MYPKKPLYQFSHCFVYCIILYCIYKDYEGIVHVSTRYRKHEQGQKFFFQILLQIFKIRTLFPQKRNVLFRLKYLFLFKVDHLLSLLQWIIYSFCKDVFQTGTDVEYLVYIVIADIALSQSDAIFFGKIVAFSIRQFVRIGQHKYQLCVNRLFNFNPLYSVCNFCEIKLNNNLYSLGLHNPRIVQFVKQ